MNRSQRPKSEQEFTITTHLELLKIWKDIEKFHEEFRYKTFFFKIVTYAVFEYIKLECNIYKKIYNLRISIGGGVLVRLLGLQLVVPGLQGTEKSIKYSF